MSNNVDRGWMYKRLNRGGLLNPAFNEEVGRFLDFAFANEQDDKIRCPCKKCKLLKYKGRDEVNVDLLRKGFMLSYTHWYAHGEVAPIEHPQQTIVDEDYNEFDGVQQMAMDQNVPGASNTWDEQDPNPHAQKFYSMLEAAGQPLWEGCRFSSLEVAARFLNWKADCNVPDSSYNRNISMVKEILPDGNQLVGSFYETKKMLKQLALPKEKIHACKNHCKLFYKEYAEDNNY